ncbi:hypothetical protein EJ05DRAFT_472094 [Pseudovirgaria hyperparasitica]|uniref:Uncharacterized protein n=1 Tax=Pseudovirgaria hyperparasitica TaxID=470096 RepID=A0A6A6WLU7_9PEZI|nr:uncharacterized protein EJ05DRAFT_472094 [Pseudovirgaria hyperparasitica]KAF2763175.1 hypothetical protein EJ05DRAFT_472094 [Pseudovirgaria hyperparasitica]
MRLAIVLTALAITVAAIPAPRRGRPLLFNDFGTTAPPQNTPPVGVDNPQNGVDAQDTNNDANAQNAAANDQQPPKNNNNGGGTIDLALIPDFGITAGNPLPGTSDCIGSVPGVPIPCTCPPSKEAFAAKLQEFLAAGQTPAGAAVSFPAGNSKQDQIVRIDTALVTLQSFTGQPGVGCPASSTTLLEQKRALQQG